MPAEIPITAWQPIETAPKDRPIILWGRYSVHPAVGEWVPAHNERNGQWVAVNDDGRPALESQTDWGSTYLTIDIPSHWMDLPTPPETEE